MKLKQCLYYDHIHLLSNLYPLHCRKFATFSSPQSHVQSIIKLCKRVEDLKPLISLIIVDGLFNYKHVISEFIEKCIHLDAPELALSAFYASQNRSLLLQNLIIKHLCNLGLYQDVINVYKSFATKINLLPHVSATRDDTFEKFSYIERWWRQQQQQQQQRSNRMNSL